MCEFLPDSAFAQELASNQDFIDLSRRIAGVIFEQMLQYPAIPAGDLAVVDFTVGGVPYLGVLKLELSPRIYPPDPHPGQRPVLRHDAPAHPAARHPQSRRGRPH